MVLGFCTKLKKQPPLCEGCFFMCSLQELLAFHLKGDVAAYLFMQFYRSRISAHFLDGLFLDLYVLAIYLNTLLLKLFGNLKGVDRSKDLTLGTGLGTNLQLHA